MIQENTAGVVPQIDPTAYVHPTASIIGAVSIGKNVFVGPGSSLRADEDSSGIIIGDDCNIQDRVIVHALKNSTVDVGNGSSLSHGCIIHGPCTIGSDCFVGFGAVVFKSHLADGVYVHHLSVLESTDVVSRKEVAGWYRNSQPVKTSVCDRSAMTDTFCKTVVQTNLDLVRGYRSRSRGRKAAVSVGKK